MSETEPPITPSPPPKKIHWATQRKLDREAAMAHGDVPPPWPSKAPHRTKADIAMQRAPIPKPVAKSSTSVRVVTPRPEFLDGLTPESCCDGCNPETGCIITGDVCGHPYKSGLQAAHQIKPLVVKRYAEARKLLGRDRADKRAG